MKWAAIATVTGQINQTAQQLLREKVEKDGAAIAATEWADFLQGTHAHINQAVQWTDVGSDPHTGNLTCLVKSDPNHPEFVSPDTPGARLPPSIQPLSRYVFESLAKRGSQLLGRTKNPVARKILESKLQGHGIQVAESLAQQEARLIHDKRKVMVGDALENLAKSVYRNPSDVEGHLADMAGVVARIADSPSERDKLLRLAREKITEAAAVGTIHKNPNAFLSNPAWQQNLSLESFVRLTHTAKTLAHQAQAHLQHQVSSLAPSHFESLLHTGKGLPGFEEQVKRAYGEQSHQYQSFQSKHALYQQASTVMQTALKAPLADGAALVESLKPQSGDPEYAQKMKMAHLVGQDLKHQLHEANSDPAAFVEKVFDEEMPANLPFLQRLTLRKSLQTQKGIPSYAQKYLMKEEKKQFLASMASDDPHQVEAAVKSLLSLEDHGRAVGKEVLEEVLSDKRDLSVLVGLYAEQALKGGDLASTFLRMIPIQKQLFSSTPAGEAKGLEDAVREHPQVVALTTALTHGQPHHVPAMNQRIQGILQLARFYQIDRGEILKDAVSHAVEGLIGREFITPIKAASFLWDERVTQADGLMVPKTILIDGKRVELDEGEANRHLLTLRKNLIDGHIPFDFSASFGSVPDNLALMEEAKAQGRNLLREGRFRLSPNQREVYYAVRMADGSEQALLKNEGEILFFPLTPDEGDLRR